MPLWPNTISAPSGGRLAGIQARPIRKKHNARKNKMHRGQASSTLRIAGMESARSDCSFTSQIRSGQVTRCKASSTLRIAGMESAKRIGEINHRCKVRVRIRKRHTRGLAMCRRQRSQNTASLQWLMCNYRCLNHGASKYVLGTYRARFVRSAMCNFKKSDGHGLCRFVRCPCWPGQGRRNLKLSVGLLDKTTLRG